MTPKKIGRYQIKAELGRGGMATVFQAYDPRFTRDVAIKVLPRAFLHDPNFRARFEREAQIIATLEHPAIVPVYDFGEEDGQPYLVMRYLPGGALDERLAQRGAYPPKEISRIFERLAPALDEAHSKGIIHRDLKPGNILFDQHDNPYLSDFGLAKLTESGSISLTRGASIGTPAYMSPEQTLGAANIDGRSDIYALGAILFEMLTGQLPYESDTPMGVAIKHVTEPVPRLSTVSSDFPPEFEAIILKAMAKEREERYSNVGEMVAALHDAVFGTAAATPAPAAKKAPARVAPSTVAKKEPPPSTPKTDAAAKKAGRLQKQGIKALKAGDKPKAVRLLKMAIDQDSNDVSTWMWLHNAVNKPAQKLACLRNARRLDPDNPHIDKLWRQAMYEQVEVERSDIASNVLARYGPDRIKSQSASEEYKRKIGLVETQEQAASQKRMRKLKQQEAAYYAEVAAQEVRSQAQVRTMIFIGAGIVLLLIVVITIVIVTANAP